MSDQTPKRPESGDDDPKGQGGEPSFNWRGLILLAIAVMLIAMAFLLPGKDGRAEQLSYPDFVKHVTEEKIDASKPLELVVKPASAEEWFIATLKPDETTEGDNQSTKEKRVRTEVYTEFQSDELKALPLSSTSLVPNIL